MTKRLIESHIYGQPWLITASGLDLVSTVAAREGNIEAVLAKRGEIPKEAKRMEIRGRVAIIPVNGPIFRFANMFTDISGATSIDSFALDFQAALDNPRVAAIIPYFGTPGGQAAGVHETANIIRSGASQKPVVGYVHDMACSAGYWLGAACPELVIDKTAELGSIGVVIGVRAQGQDQSVIEFVSPQSPKKRLDPNTEEGKNALLERAGAMAQVFVESVAAFRNVSVDTVLADFGQGGVLIGEDAVAAGMADRTGSLEELIAELNDNTYQPLPNRTGSTAASAAHKTMEVSQMDKKELLAKYPEACQALINDGKAEGKKDLETAVAAARTEGATAARTGFLDLMTVQAGEEQAAAFKVLLDTGVSADQLKAIRAMNPAQPAAAVAGVKTEMLAAIQNAGAQNPGAGSDNPAAAKDFDTLVADYQAAQPGCKKSAAIKACRAANPKAYDDWMVRVNAAA